MYPEFIGIYVGLGILAIILIIILVLILSIFKKLKEEPLFPSSPFVQYPINQETKQTDNNNSSVSTGVVFCKKCSNQFKADQNNCPHCGASR